MDVQSFNQENQTNEFTRASEANELQSSPLPRSATCCRGMFAAVLGSCPLPALFQHRMLTIAKDLECAVNKQKMHVNKQKMHVTEQKMQYKLQIKGTKQTKRKSRTSLKPQKGKNNRSLF